MINQCLSAAHLELFCLLLSINEVLAFDACLADLVAKNTDNLLQIK